MATEEIIDWDQKLKEVRDMVAKGYSADTPRWLVGDCIRGLMRIANKQGDVKAYDLLVFELDAWNRKQ